MAPRIANDCFPDEFLTVDYDAMAPIGMTGPGGGGGVGMGGGNAGTHPAAGDMVAGDLNLDGDGAAAAAAAMADAELDAVPQTALGVGVGNALAGDDGNATAAAVPSAAIENDPLSVGQPGIAASHSHSSASGSEAIQLEGIAAVPTVGTAGTLGTTVTVTMAAAAQQAWDQFVAGQEAENQQHQFQQQFQPQVHGEGAVAVEGITIGGTAAITIGGTAAMAGGYSPSSIPQTASPSTASIGMLRGSPPVPSILGHHGHPGSNETTPTSYQQLLQQQQQQQHRQDILNATSNSNDPLSVHSAPAAAPGTAVMAAGAAVGVSQQQQHRGQRRVPGHDSAVPGRPVPRAASFGGFPSPQGVASRPTSAPAFTQVTLEHAPPGPAPEAMQTARAQAQVQAQAHPLHLSSVVTPATVSRSNSIASSLTGSLHGSVHTSANSTTYQRFLSGLQQQASQPLEAIPPSEVGDSSPQETYASIHSSGAFSTSIGLPSPNNGSSPGSDSKMSSAGASHTSGPSPGGSGGGSFSHSPKLPYSPSLLDQTSFPEEDLSVGGDDDDSGDKYSPISKIDWSGADCDEGDGKIDAVDVTADTTASSGLGVHMGLSPGAVSQGLATHVIHEDSALMAEASPPASTALRPRPSPYARASSGSNGISAGNSSNGNSSQDPGAVAGVTPTNQRRGLLVRNEAFELSPARPQYRHQVSDVSIASNDGSVQLHVTPPPLSFGSETTISDLTYYAEKGCIVDVLAALTNPHLKTLGSRMLADYAKMPHRRVAVASNMKILEFVQSTALEIGSTPPQPGYPRSPSQRQTHDHVAKYTSPSWLGREYAVETVRSLTAAEENDKYLMTSPGLLRTLALVARGGPFVRHEAPHAGRGGYLAEPAVVAVPPPSFADNGTPGPRLMMDNTMSISSDKARLHACIAIMNLSCGKNNKVDITNVPEVLEAMRDVMLGRHFSAPPRTSMSGSRTSNNVADEARLKATTCIKNLSNADANDAALLGTPGLVETLGYVAEATCHPRTGATTCTTHACLALMNLSISKANKNKVFRTPGVMDALMAVITRTAPKPGASTTESPNPKDPNFEARVKACSALSNLAIGYDNKIPMFHYPGFVESILTVIRTDTAEARTKACSILWSFAAEMKNQVPVVRRGDILPALVSVAKEDTKTEARFKCVAALTLLAESPENAVPLLKAGSLEPLMNVLQEAGPDPTQWRGQTASWCVGFLMNMAQCDDVVPALLQEGIVDLLAPLLSLDHYQSLKAAMAVTFVCQYDTGDKTYNLLRQTENVIPKIVGLLHNTLSGRGGSGYKYGVFTLRSSVGCIASLAAGPDFMKERIATNPVFESLLKVVEDFCVDGGTPGAIVGGGKDDTRSVTLAVRALSSLIGHLIPEPNSASMPFGPSMDDQLITALQSFELNTHVDIDNATRRLAHSARIRVEGGKNLSGRRKDGSVSSDSGPDDLSDDGGGIGLSLARRFFPFPCGMNLHVPSDPAPPAAPALPPPSKEEDETMDITDDTASASSDPASAVRTFLLTDSTTGRRYAVPCDPTGGRQFNDNRVWCFRRGRYCEGGESPDPNFRWSDELQAAYNAALRGEDCGSASEP